MTLHAEHINKNEGMYYMKLFFEIIDKKLDSSIEGQQKIVTINTGLKF